MPPLTLDSLLHGGAGGGEPEDACEDEFSGSDDDSSGAGSEDCGGDDVDGDYDPYSPAESLWLRIGEDIDWSEVGAVLEREDSTKGASNPKSACSCGAPAARMSTCVGGGGTATAPTKAVEVVVIAGLPAAARKVSREHGRRRRLGRARARARARVFAGDAVEVVEPGSPKVSCLGGVRSRAQAQQPYCPAGAAGRRRWRWSCASWLVQMPIPSSPADPNVILCLIIVVTDPYVYAVPRLVNAATDPCAGMC
uniref:Uncharacterized protein n=1 Tax=Oryza punctata TaxID=4537 RepID=A0A0E0K0N1_ORYPU